jgi:hypothetical protein
VSASFASGEGFFVTRYVWLEDGRLTPVPSGHVLSETSGSRGRPVLVEFKLIKTMSADSALQERFPITWKHVIEKESLKFKEVEQVLIEKVEQLFRDML